MKRLAVSLALVALVLAAAGVHARDTFPAPQISVTPASYDFGNVPIGAVSPGTLMVKNIGSGTLIVRAVKTKAPFFDGATSFTLGAGQSRRVNIGFAPTAPVQYNSVCTFVSNAFNGTVLSVPLTGWGVE